MENTCHDKSAHSVLKNLRHFRYEAEVLLSRNQSFFCIETFNIEKSQNFK